ncbi:15857_t:CDS:2, partial [Dentiscutata erythropus]
MSPHKGVTFCEHLWPTSIKAHYTKNNINKNRSIPWLLGFLNTDNIRFLYTKVHEKYPWLFQNYHNTMQAFQKETTLRKSLQKESQQIDFSLRHKEPYIENGIILEANGKHLTSKETQALIIIKDQQLGSTILIDTKQYLTLVLTQACSNCFQTNQKWKITKLGLTVKCISKCRECKSYIVFNNEAEGMNYTLAYAAAGLVGEVTRHALQTILASFGITSQICEKIYNTYQSRLFSRIIDGAKKSAELALRRCIEFINLSENPEFRIQVLSNQYKDDLETNSNYQVVKRFPVGFDTSWSHCRNANQESGEFIFQSAIP